MRGSTRWPDLAMVLALCLCSLAFFWRVVVLHDALIPMDILWWDDPLWRSSVPHGFGRIANTYDFDNVMQFYPWATLIAKALHQHVIPLWNPYSFAGMPFLAATQPAAFYPISLFLDWITTPAAVIGWRAIVHLTVTLAGTYLFARCLSLSRPAAGLAALAYGFSLPYVVWIEHPIGAAFAWVPWILLCIDRTVATRGSERWLLVTALILAIEFLAGHSESTIHIVLFASAYAAFRLVRARRRENGATGALRPLVALGVAALFGAALAAVQLLPSLSYLPHSQAAVERGLAGGFGQVPFFGVSDSWKTIVQALVPNFFGNPTWPVFLLPLKLNYHETSLYIGTMPLLLATLALVYRRDSQVVFFAIAALVALGMALTLPVFGLLDDLPILHAVTNGRLRVIYALATALLAGYGLDALVCGATGRSAWRLACAWELVLTPVAALGVILVRQDPAGHTLPLWSTALVVAPVLWLGVFLVLLGYRRRGVLPAPGLQWATVAVTVIDLFTAGIGYHTYTSSAQAASVPPAVQLVERDPSLFRVAGLGNALWPDTSALYGLQDIRGYDPAVSADYARFFAQTFSTVWINGARVVQPMAGDIGLLAERTPTPSEAAMLDLLNVKYLFTDCLVQLDSLRYTLLFGGSGCVYWNRTVLPRGFLVHRIQPSGIDPATALLSQGAVDPRSVALIDAATPVVLPAGMARQRKGTRTDQVTLTHDDLNGIDFSVRTARAGVLVVTDIYDAGWQATVDGLPTRVLCTDAVFQGLALGPGSHHVRLLYRPASFTIGASISAGACLLWLLAAAWVVARGCSQATQPAGRQGPDYHSPSHLIRCGGRTAPCLNRQAQEGSHGDDV